MGKEDEYYLLDMHMFTHAGVVYSITLRQDIQHLLNCKAILKIDPKNTLLMGSDHKRWFSQKVKFYLSLSLPHQTTFGLIIRVDALKLGIKQLTINYDMTCLVKRVKTFNLNNITHLNKQITHHDPFNKQIVLGWVDPTRQT